MNKKILVTIVIPVYNVEKYIRKCIESLQSQTYSNIEMIVVNDGTKDNSLNIVKEMATFDNRIKIISQENQGLSMARNTGIQNANGEYICFVDSDDFVHKDYVKLLLENVIENDADIGVCDFWYIDETGKTWSRKEKKKKVYSNIEAIKDILTNEQDTEVMTWNKLYKTSLFRDNSIYFPKGKLHEDNFTTYKLYYYANKIVLKPDKLYYYLQRKTSIMGKKFNTRRLDILQAVEETKKFIQDKEIELKQEIEFYKLMTQINLLNNMIRDGFKQTERYQMVEKIKKDKAIYKKNKYINKKTKIALSLLIGKGNLYAFSIRILDKVKGA